MILDFDTILKFRPVMERRGRIIVTNGVFDVIHAGHITLLAAARALGDVLWVGLNSDESVRKLKGEGRPINSEADRACVLDAIRWVDYVTIFRTVRCDEFLRLARPAYYAKGGDYSLSTLDPGERAVLEACGARIVFIPTVPGLSTTRTIAKLSALPQAGGDLVPKHSFTDGKSQG
jgi:rfaE bifunctional protein nucleotidyltransferase chain/domain